MSLENKKRIKNIRDNLRIDTSCWSEPTPSSETGIQPKNQHQVVERGIKCRNQHPTWKKYKNPGISTKGYLKSAPRYWKNSNRYFIDQVNHINTKL